MNAATTVSERRLAHTLFLLIFSFGFFRYAWITEDAFINFRVIQNFINGDGLVWNLGERVQVFTSPLWMMLSLLCASLTGEIFFTTIGLSYVLTLVTLWLLFLASNKNLAVFLGTAALLLLTQSYIDYSSSGLETPLLALTCSAFYLLYFRSTGHKRRTFILALAASICAITRHDSVIFTAPFVIQHFVSLKNSYTGAKFAKELSEISLGAIPLVAWTLFSIIYYGFPVPNTARAKIVLSIEAFDPLRQTINYIEYMQQFDPLAFVLIALAIFVATLMQSRALIPFCTALVLFFLYLLHIGSDYMAGRFFIVPLVLAAFILADSLPALLKAQQRPSELSATGRRLALVALIVPNIALASVYLTARNSSEYNKPLIINGIADERSIYFPFTDFVTVISGGDIYHPFKATGETIRGLANPSKELAIACHIGMLGYFAGSDIHIVDPIALSDAFLSGLPPRPGEQRVGHFERFVPREYLLSLLSSQNRFSNPAASAYYEDIVEASRRPLFTLDRLEAIWRLNFGYHNKALRDIKIEEVGGAALIENNPVFRFHTCLGGEKTPAFLAGESEIVNNRFLPIKLFSHLSKEKTQGSPENPASLVKR